MNAVVVGFGGIGDVHAKALSGIENVTFSYRNSKLYENGELICADSDEWVGKKYWGNGHEKTLYDLYENGSKLCLDDVKNTMDILFAIYKSAENKTKL